MNSTILSLEGISRTFSSRYILHHLDLQVMQGEAVLVTGANGAGKTTLLRIAATLLFPTSGTIRLFGEEVSDNRPLLRKKLGVLMTDSYLYGDLTVRENLLFYAQLHGVPNPDTPIRRWLDRFEMKDFADIYVQTLSRGERQRISIIQSLLHEPECLLWDEPTSGLDGKAKNIVREIVLESKGKTTFLCTTHDVAEMSSWFDRKVELQGGKIR